MAFVSFRDTSREKYSDICRCAYLSRWCASSEVKRKAAYVSISTRLPWLLASPRRIFFPPRLFVFHPLSSRAMVIVVLPALRRGAVLTTPALCRSPASWRSPSLSFLPLFRRCAPWASGGRLCTTFRPRWCNGDHTRPFIADTSLLHDISSFPKQTSLPIIRTELHLTCQIRFLIDSIDFAVLLY